MKNKTIKITCYTFAVYVINNCTTDSLLDLTIAQEIETVNYTENINADDFAIEIPSVVSKKVSDKVKINLEFILK